MNFGYDTHIMFDRIVYTLEKFKEGVMKKLLLAVVLCFVIVLGYAVPHTILPDKPGPIPPPVRGQQITVPSYVFDYYICIPYDFFI